jgi:hypothetical protein
MDAALWSWLADLLQALAWRAGPCARLRRGGHERQRVDTQVAQIRLLQQFVESIHDRFDLVRVWIGALLSLALVHDECLSLLEITCSCRRRLAPEL